MLHSLQFQRKENLSWKRRNVPCVSGKSKDGGIKVTVGGKGGHCLLRRLREQGEGEPGEIRARGT
jgi:hypothetical protein